MRETHSAETDHRQGIGAGPDRQHVPGIQRRPAAGSVPAVYGKNAAAESHGRHEPGGRDDAGGIGSAAIIPLINAGFVDWIVSTGANLYHDMHHAMNMPLFRGSPFSPDPELRKLGVVRIYDILLDYNDVLMATDHVLRQILMQPEFQHEMGTTELHYLLGKYCAEFEEQTGRKDSSVLAAAYRAGVPCFCPSPGDSTIGMNIAGLELRNNALRINPSRDVNESTGIVLAAKRAGFKTGTLLIGGGSPKNFTLQTEPQIQEVLRVKEEGHDYFIQFTDARPDTGGLSGATPHEAVTWGKVDPLQLPDAVVCYVDSTVAFPLLAHYALAKLQAEKAQTPVRQASGNHGIGHKRILETQQTTVTNLRIDD